ncbi:hypothetical protein [Actinocorallia longicatena]|uniref:Secreted protein with PEP-CTERM sorting signal n=1 Tax=Actinocorallia longicatena TaxID=111803 RepID=A0ABP6QCB9_9ACTN
MTPVLAHHAAIEAIALFIPALAIIGVIAGAVILDRRRAADDEEEGAEPETGQAADRQQG